MSGAGGRRRSSTVRLVLLGAAGSMATGLGGCGQLQRNVYDRADECSSDYSSMICASKGQQLADRFLGPAYRVVLGRASACDSTDPGPGRLVGSTRKGVETVSRSGFGTTCRSRTSSRRGYGFFDRRSSGT